MIAYADGFGNEAHRFCPANFLTGNWIMGLMFILVLGIVIYFAIKGFTSRQGEDEDIKKEALAAIKVRFAKGEISQEEYDNIKKKILEE